MGGFYMSYLESTLVHLFRNTLPHFWKFSSDIFLFLFLGPATDTVGALHLIPHSPSIEVQLAAYNFPQLCVLSQTTFSP